MRRTLLEYSRALGKWLWVLIADILGIVQALVIEVPILSRIPVGVWVGLFVLFLFIANISAFHKLRLERDQFGSQLQDRQNLRKVLASLARLRTKGVALRNEGARLLPDQDSASWLKKAAAWEESVRKTMAQLSRAQAELFRTLDWVTVRPFRQELPPQVRHYLNMLSDEVENIRRFVDRCDPLFAKRPDA